MSGLDAQLDYLSFLHGLSLLELAAIVYSLARREEERWRWKWIAGFGLLRGVDEWLNLLALATGNVAVLGTIGTVVRAGSFLWLLEFGRAFAQTRNPRTVGSWVAIPLLGLAALGGMVGWEGTNAGVRYALGVPAGLWASWALWREPGRQNGNERAFRNAAVAVGLYTLAGGLVPPEAAFFPASVLNRTSFLSFVGLPVELLAAYLAAVVALAFGRIAARLAEPSEDSSWPGYDRFLFALLGLVLLLGWAATEWQGRRWQREERAELMDVARVGAAAVDPRHVVALAGAPADLTSGDYRRLKEQLLRMRHASPKTRFVYLMRRVGAEIVFLVDSEPAGSPDESPPGQVYDEATPTFRSMFATGTGGIEGPVTDRWGTWMSASAPVAGRTGQMVAMLGMDVNATQWAVRIAHARLTVILIVVVLTGLILFFFVAQRRDRAEMARRRKAEREKEALLHKLQESIDRVGKLEGLLPVCSGCHRIRVESPSEGLADEWVSLEDYVRSVTSVKFTHGLCDACIRRLYPEVHMRPDST
jgi:hypothetical protein